MHYNLTPRSGANEIMDTIDGGHMLIGEETHHQEAPSRYQGVQIGQAGAARVLNIFFN